MLGGIKYFYDSGENYKADFYTCIDEKGKVSVDLYYFHSGNYYFHKTHYLKAYFRNERTWDDHMGNSEWGYFVVMPLPHNNGTKRVYIPCR